jgi:O-antigen ligase
MMAGCAEVVIFSLVTGAFLGLLGLVVVLHFRGAFFTPESSAEVLQSLASPFIVVPNDLLFFVVVFPFLGFLWRSSRITGRRFGRVVEVIYLSCLVVLSSWAGSFSLALFTGFLGVIFLLGPRFVVIAVCSIPFTLLFPLALACVAFLLEEEIVNFIARETRPWIWHVSWQAISSGEKFYMGVGPGNFDLFFSEARHFFNAPAGLAEDPRRMGWAHNLFLEGWIERGVTGFVSTLLVFALILSEYFKLAELNKAFLLPAAAFFLFFLISCMELSFIRPWVPVLFAIHLGLVLTSDGAVEPLEIAVNKLDAKQNRPIE